MRTGHGNELIESNIYTGRVVPLSEEILKLKIYLSDNKRKSSRDELKCQLL